MADTEELSYPIRLNTYRDEKTHTQVFQWVVGEYDAEALAKWKSVISGKNSIVEDVNTVDLIAEMYFSVTTNTTAGGVVLFIDQAPTLTLNGQPNGECVYGGDTEKFDVDEELFNTNALKIYKNGVLQMKGSDVVFVSDNHIRLADRLQVGDIIVIDHVRGV